MATQRIGILTGGGDVPGLNSVIKEVTYRATENNCEVVGIRRGWEGLTHVRLDDSASKTRYILPLTRENTRTIDRYGGTVLHSSRTNPAKMPKLPDFLNGQGFPEEGSHQGRQDIHGLRHKPAGAEEHRSVGAHFPDRDRRRRHVELCRQAARFGVKVIAVPKTMDNDVRNTEYCIGFSTAITRATDAIARQRTTVGSHERIGIFRVFGRDAGFTSLYTAFVASIRCCIPEYKVNLEKLIDLLMTDKKNNPSNYCLVILSEGAEWEGYQVREYGEPDAFGHRKKENVGEALASEIHAPLIGGDHRQRPDLRSAQRRAGFRGQAGGLHLRHHGAGGGPR